MQDTPPVGVTTKTKTATKAVAAVGLLMLLGLTAYGFGFTIAGPKKGTLTTDLVRQQQQKTAGGAQLGGTLTGTLSPSVCNQEEASKGGAGRCYPTCKEKGDCMKAGYVSDFKECVTKSVAICGDSKECAKMVCGEETPDCVQGFCSRPNLALTRAQCPSTPSQFADIPLTTGDRCATESGKCYKGCTVDSDCVDLGKYELCVKSAAVKTACTGNALIGGLDPTCAKQMCGEKPVAAPGSCVKDSAGKPSYCKTPLDDIGKPENCVVKIAVNDNYSVETGERVWISSCAKSKAICGSDADCAAPAVEAVGVSCDLSSGSCFRRCETDQVCAAGYDKYATCVSSKKNVEACTKATVTNATAIDQACLKTKCGNAPTATAGSCLPASGGIPSHCATAVPRVTSQSACTPIAMLDSARSVPSNKNVWVGTCPDKKTACRTSAECKPPAPVLPSFGKWTGVCPSATAPGVANCTATELGSCTQPGGTPSCDMTKGQCLRRCESDTDCRPEMKACVEAAEGVCKTIDSNFDDCMKARIPKCEALGVCPKPSSTGGKSYCPSILPGTDASSCKNSGGVWFGACRQDASKRCSGDSECMTGEVAMPQGEKKCMTETGRCYVRCETAEQCSGTIKPCLEAAKAKCALIDMNFEDCVKAENAKCESQAQCTKVGNLPSRCQLTLPATTSDKCGSLGGTWFGTCSTNPSAECRTVSDCQ